MINKTIFINDSSVVDLSPYGNMKDTYLAISGTDLKFVFGATSTINIVNGALYSSLENSNVTFKFRDGTVISGRDLLKTIDLSHLELERLDSSLSETRQEQVIKDESIPENQAEQQLEAAKKESEEIKKEVQAMKAEVEESRQAAKEIEEQLNEFLDEKAKNKTQNSGSGQTEIPGTEQFAASAKTKKYDDDSVAAAKALKLSDYTSSSSSSSSSSKTSDTPEIIVKVIDISLRLDETSDSGTKNDNITNAISPIFVGSTEPNLLISILVDDIVVGTTNSDAMGNFSFVYPGELADGEHTVKADVSDGEGGRGSASFIVTIDTVTDTPTFELDAQYAIATEDQIPGENLTRFKEASISGTAEANVKIEIQVNGKSVANVVADADGKWSYQFSTGQLAEGVNDIEIVALDKAGNTASVTGLITLDTIPPAQPTVILDEASDSGTYHDDKLTFDTTPSFHGLSEPDGKLELRINNQKMADLVADSEGNWHYTLSDNQVLTDGTYTVNVIASDRAGNTSETHLNIEIDTNIDLFSIKMDTASDSGTAGDSYTNNVTPAFSGKTDPSSHLVITNLTTGATLEINASQAGNFSFTSPGISAEGVNELQITVTDLAGNTATYSESYTIDTIPPLAPTLALEEYVASQSGNILTRDTTPDLTGSAEAGSKVIIYVDGKIYATVSTDANLQWNYTFPSALSEGLHTACAVAQDLAGNNSPASPDYVFYIDTVTSVPVAVLDPEDDSGVKQNDWITNHNDNLSLTGVAEAYATLEITFDGVVLGRTTADASGNWRYEIDPNPALGDDTYKLQVMATDEVGNQASVSYSLVIDTVTVTPTLRLDPTSDTGSASDDAITKDNQPLLNGTAEAGSQVDVYIDGIACGSVIATKDGIWNFRVPASGKLSDGEHSISVTATDIAGNSASSMPFQIQIDTQIAAPTISLLTDTGDSSSDRWTKETIPTFRGEAEPFSSLILYRDGVSMGKISADANGQWQYVFNDAQALSDGSYIFYVVATDVAGNTATSDRIQGQIDTTLAMPVVDLASTSDSGYLASDRWTNDTTPTLVLTKFDPDVTHVQISIDGVSYDATLVAGQWSYTPLTPLTDGEHHITATVTDGAGNVATSGVLDITIDTVTTPPLIALVDDSGVLGDNVTNDTTPGFAVVTDNDAFSVMVSVDGGQAIAATKQSDGHWQFTVPVALADGSHTLSATVTDGAGNTAQSSLIFTTDTHITSPTLDLLDSSDTGISRSDNWTSNTAPTFAIGNLDADVVDVGVLMNGVRYAATKTGTDWSFTPPAALADGDYVFQVRATDAADNTTLSAPLNVKIDTVTAVPVIMLTDDTGVKGDNLTNLPLPAFAISTDTDVAQVMVSVDNGVPLAATKDSDGHWHFTPSAALSDGSHILTVTVTDGAGNTSLNSLTFAVDTLLQIPTIDLTSASDSGFSSTDNLTNDTTPTFAIGNVDSDVVSVEVLINGVSYNAVKSGNNWGFTPDNALPDAQYNVQVRVTDAAGNIVTSAALSVTIDTVTAVPVITLSDDTGVKGDNLTNVTTPAFSITTDSDVVQVMVMLDNGVAAEATKTSDGHWHFTVADMLADGAHTLTATVTDAAGNTRQNVLNFSVDTQLQAATLDLVSASDSGTSSADNWTNDSTPTFAIGNVEADVTTVEVLINGVSYAAANTGGNWSFTPDSELADGDYAVQVRVTDIAGNIATSAALNVQIDTVTALPVITLSDDTGVAGDNLTNNTTPGFAIATDADVVQVMVTLDNGAAIAATKESNGMWHYTVPSSLADGAHRVTVNVTDGAGNTSQGALTFSVDTALHTPTIDLTDASDSGISQSDNWTQNTTPTFSIGNIDSDVISVNVLINGVSYTAVKTGAQWGFTPDGALSDAIYQVQVQATDAAGNIATSTALAVNIDTHTSEPVITLTDDSGIKGDGITNDTTPGFAIVTDADVVQVMVGTGNGPDIAAVKDSNGHWHYNVPTALENGTYSLNVTVTDGAGNTNQNSMSFTIDYHLSPATIDLVDTSDSGISRSDNWTNNATPAFAIDNLDIDVVNIEVLIDGIVYDAIKTGDTWGFTPSTPLTDGTHNVQVRVTDSAANTATSATLVVNIDTFTAEPVITLTDDSGVKGDDVTQNTRPGFTIATDPDVYKAMVSLDGASAVAAIRDSDGHWHFNTPEALKDGAHTLSVIATDGADNTGQSTLTFTIDTQLNTPTVDLADASDSGVSASDNWTNDTTPTFNIGNLDPDVVAVEVLINGISYTATKTGSSWSCTPQSPLTDAVYSVQARATDAAGNIATSAAILVTVDTVTAAPVVTLSDDTGVQGDYVTKNTTPGFAIATDNDVVQVMVSLDNGLAVAAEKESDGHWRYSVPAALTDGAHPLVVTVTDGAGNTRQSTIKFTVDTQVQAPTLDLLSTSDTGISNTDNITHDKLPAFAIGNVDADVISVEVLINGVSALAMNNGGNWSFTPDSALADDVYSVQVRATDAAGNVATSNPISVTVDTLTTRPVITLSDDSGVKGDNLTNDSTPGFAITTDTDVVQAMVSLDNGPAVAAVKGTDGNWQYALSSALADGEHSLAVTITDRAGNTQQNTLTFGIDTHLSVPTLAIAPADDSGYSNTDGITNKTRPAFALGNIDTDVNSVQITLDGVSYQAAKNGNTWSFTPASELADGTYTVELQVTDIAGNQRSITKDIKIDTQTSVDGITLTDDTGVQNDWRTNKPASAFSITAPADTHTVTVALDNGQSRDAVLVSGKWVFTLAADTTDGAHVLHITVTDEAGNTAALDQNFIVDTVLSPLTIDLLTADDTADNSDNITRVRTPRFALGNVPDDVFSVTVNLDGQTYTLQPQSDGSYSFMPPQALADNQYELVVTVTDTAGNTRSSSLSFEVDTTTSVTNIVLLNDTGDSATDNLTNASQPRFQVTTPTDVISMTAMLGGIVCSATKTANGVWEVVSPELSTSGDYTLLITVTDRAGNQTTENKLITFDNQLAVPVVSFVAGDDTGANTSDHLTMNTRPQFAISNVDADVTSMHVTLKGVTVEVMKDASGNWIYRPASVLADDTYSMTVQVQDRAGNIRAATFEFVVDTHISAPVIDMTTESDSGDSQSDNKTNDTTPQFTFSNIDADVDTLQVTLNNITYNVRKDTGGNWAWTAPELNDGAYKLIATATDLAGNTISTELAFVIDTVVAINNIAMSADSGYSNSDRLTNDTRPTFEIQVPADVTHVSVKVDNGSVVDLVKTGGKWTYTCGTMTDGAHTLLVTAQDDAGNATSQQIAFEIDTTLNPISIDLRDVDDSGVSATDNITNNQQPVFLFNGIPSDAYSLNVRLNNQDYAVALNTSPVSFKPPAALTDGTYTLVSTLTDKAGNTTESALVFTIDSVTSVAVDFIEGDDSGYSDSDNYTNKNAPTFEIAVPADVVSVTVVEDGTSTALTKNSAGKWFFTSPSLTEGVHSLVVNVVDKAGNTASTSLNFTVDMTIAMPHLDLNTASDSGYSSTDNLTNDNTPAFTITGTEASDIHLVSVTINGRVYDVKQAGGQWIFQLPNADALDDGEYEVTVRSEDNAGNTKTSSLTVNIDTQCASPLVVLREADNSGVITDSITNQTHPRFMISGAPDDLYSVSVELNGQVYSVNKTAGYWDLPSTLNLSDGDYTLKVTFTDNAGNQGSTLYDFTLDTKVLTPNLVLTDDTGQDIHDNLTNVNIPRFEVTAGEALFAVIVTLNGRSVTLNKNAQGKWIYTADRMLSDGTYTVSADLVDIAGNHTQRDLTFTVDTQIPTPTIDMNDASDSGASNTDNLTNIKQPVFTLTNIPDDIDTVRVSIGGAAYDATQDSHGNWTVRPNNLADGDYIAVVTSTDKAGNQVQSSLAITIDTTLVLSIELASASDTGVSQSDKLTKDNTPTIQGMTDRDASLTVIVTDADGKQVSSQTLTPLPDGSWSLTLDTLPDGQYTAKVQAEDLAGNKQAQSLSFVIDTYTAPPSVALSESDPENIHIALNLAPELSGIAEAGSSLQIKIDGAAIASVTVDSNGSWKWTPPSALLSGEHLVTVQATDRAGNVSRETSFGIIIPIVDIDPPSLMLTSATDSGSLGDFITQSTAPTLTGVTLPGTAVTIYINGQIVGTTQTDSTGRYSYSLAAKAEGTYAVHVSIIDPNTNLPVNSTVAKLVVDTHIEDLLWNISSLQTGGYLSDSTPTIYGTSEPGARLQVLVDGKVVIETATSSDGNWSVTLPNIGADGSHNISFNVTDIAGNTKSFGPETVILDTQIAQLTVNLRASDDTGSSASDCITSKTLVTLEGVAEANSTVTIYSATGTRLGSVKASATGVWSCAVSLSEGNNVFVVKAEDAAANSTQKNITVQCDTSNEITDISLTRASNSGDIYDLITNNKTPTVTALTDPRASVEIYVNGVKTTTVTADASGIASCTLGNSADGTYSIRFVSTDLAGNIATSNVATLVIDSVIENFTVNTLPELTNSSAQTASGTGEPGARIQVSINGKIIAESDVDNSGNWAVPLLLKEDGDYKITVTITDVAGNTQTSSEQSLKLDSKTDNPTILLDTASNSGVTSDLITNDKTPSFHGSAEANAKVSILVNEVVVATVTANSAGQWSWTQPTALTDGEYYIRVIAEDAALNTADSQRLLVVIDTSTEIEINRFTSDNGYIDGDHVTNQKRPTFELVGEKGQPVEVRIDGVYIETVIITSKTYAYTVPAALADGSHTIAFSITDAAGNTATTGNYNFSIDTINDTAISLESVNGQAAADVTQNGLIYVSDASKNLELSGKAEASSLVTVTFNGLEVGQVWATSTGTWSMSINRIALAEGEISVNVKSEDRGSNSKSESFTIVVDTRISQFSVDVSDNKSGTSDRWAVNAANNTFFGRGEPGAIVTLLLAGVVVASAAVAADGNWQISTSQLQEGNQTLTFTISDSAGNSQTLDHTILIDRTAPETPSVTNSAYLAESGLWVFTGKSEAGATLIIQNGSGSEITTTQVDSSGNWSVAFSYPTDGKVSFHARDTTGNESDALTIDSLLTHPSISLDTASDSGITGDFITNDTTPTFVLSNIESDVKGVVVTLNGEEYLATHDGDHWTFTPSKALADGQYILHVTTQDGAGNHSSSDVGFTIDTTAPLPAAVHSPDDHTQTPAEDAPLVLENSQPSLVFEFPADTVQASVMFNNERHELSLNENHQATFEVPVALADGPYSLTLSAADAAGNSQSHDVEFTVDTSSAQVVASMADEPREDSVEAAETDHQASSQQTFVAEVMSYPTTDELTDADHHS